MSKEERRLAYDTRALPTSALTSEEIDILRDINGLLRQAKENSTNSFDPGSSPWSRPEEDRRNNIIMLDGERGAGKTSLLLTLLDGWARPDKFKSLQRDNDFEGMHNTVRALTPIDFDPLPPALPIYNWIIQAFYPLVRKVSSKSPTQFVEPVEYDTFEDSLSGRYRKLHHAAAVGWTTGLLKQALEKDTHEFLLWQEEQQLNWQNLRDDWQQFLDALLSELEQSSSLPQDDKLPLDGIIVLPIDDLDLQVERTRELLLTLRVLRHRRLVYLLTGDKDGTDKALQASFYRDFTRGISTISENFRDNIVENTSILGPRLREKTIPSSHLFKIGGHNIKGAMGWSPLFQGKTIAKLLDELWSEGDVIRNPSKKPRESISRFLRDRYTYDNKNVLPFRALQSFFDRWVGDSNVSNIMGVVDFLKIIVEDPKEEALTISGPTNGGPIEISSNTAVYAPAPRLSGSIQSNGGVATIKWAKRWDFVREVEDKDVSLQIAYEPASPGHLLALDLASWAPSEFAIVSDLRLVDRPLGLVWTELAYDGENIVIPWPGKTIVNSPSEWIRQSTLWCEHLDKYSNSSGFVEGEDILKAWCTFLAGRQATPDTPLGKLLEYEFVAKLPNIADLGTEIFGLSANTIKTIRDQLGDGDGVALQEAGVEPEKSALSANRRAFALGESDAELVDRAQRELSSSL